MWPLTPVASGVTFVASGVATVASGVDFVASFVATVAFVGFSAAGGLASGIPYITSVAAAGHLWPLVPAGPVIRKPNRMHGLRETAHCRLPS